MSAYVRLIIGDKGNVLKVVMDSLYHPDEQTKDCIKEVLGCGGLECIDEDISDSEVLILFHLHSYQSNHPLDPVEYETDIVIDQTIILQGSYKEYTRKKLESYMERLQGCYTIPTKIEDAIGEWEELFDEDFYHDTKKEVIESGDDPFCTFKHGWRNTQNV